MGRRRQAFKALGLGLALFVWIIATMLVVALTMVFMLPVSILWVINPSMGDRALDRLSIPLGFMLNPPNSLDN